MNISLRADEKLYINGAVLRVDRKVTIELQNDSGLGHNVRVHTGKCCFKPGYKDLGGNSHEALEAFKKMDPMFAKGNPAQLAG